MEAYKACKMITLEQLDERLKHLEAEKAALVDPHQKAAEQLQKLISQYQTKHVFLSGAIEEINKLKNQLNGEEP